MAEPGEMEIKPGETLFDIGGTKPVNFTLGEPRYEILELLSPGVCLAQDNKWGRQVVVKSESLSPDLYAEALKQAQATHPNVANIFDIAMDSSHRLHLVIEYVRGKTLEDWIKEGNFSREDIVSIVQQIAFGLDSFHSKGIIHRDLKPTNILLGEENHVKIADFGIAGRKGESAPIGETPGFAPPEQWSDEVDPATDIYSLGVVIFSLLTGKAEGQEVKAAIEKFRKLRTLPLSESFANQLTFNQKYLLENLLVQALNSNKEKRQKTAGELAAGLQNALFSQEE